MSLMPMNTGYGSYGGYGTANQNTNPEIQDIQRQRRLAEMLRQQGSQELQGQMVSGHYVKPALTQGLAKLLQTTLGAYQEGKADTAEKDYNSQKNKRFADILNGNKEKQIQGTPTVTTSMPAYEPSQMDQFGSPLPNVQRTPIETTQQNFTTETPQQVADRQRASVYDYVNKYGASPEAQLLLADFNHQRDRGEHKEDILDQRTYEGTTHQRDRGEHLQDVQNAQEFQRILQKENFGQQLTMQEKQFAQQYKLQQSSQNFQAGQNKLSRDATLANATPIAVVGPDGKPTYVAHNDAIGKSPYSAKQEAADALKVQQKAQSEISTQQVLDQALALHQHPGRNMGTGLTSFTSAIPGTDARGFKANLDTFKAQTFIPMVSALKGMGALSDAEGKKLSDSVGALDPGMSSKEFDASLQKITKTLYDKARASGLNVSMPEFGIAASPDTTQAGGIPSQDAIAAELKRRGL